MRTLEQDPIDPDITHDCLIERQAVTLNGKSGEDQSRDLYMEMEDWYREEARSAVKAA